MRTRLIALVLILPIPLIPGNKFKDVSSAPLSLILFRAIEIIMVNKTVRILDLSLTIHKSIEEVWQYLIDPNTIIEYCADMANGTVQLENGDNNKLCQGSKLEVVDNYKRKFVTEITVCNEPTEMKSKVIDGPSFVGSSENFQLKDLTNDGIARTELSYTWDMSGSFLFRMIQSLQFYRNIYWKYKYKSDFLRMKDILEKGGESAEHAKSEVKK
eukprot:263614_1